MTYERDYALTKTLPLADFASTIQRIKDALATEGFGVLTEIDIQATLKKKLAVDRHPYVILGACHPQTADLALQTEPAIGVFLPCNVTLFQTEDALIVQAIHPHAMFSLLQNPHVQPMADEITARLQRALERL